LRKCSHSVIALKDSRLPVPVNLNQAVLKNPCPSAKSVVSFIRKNSCPFVVHPKALGGKHFSQRC
ncbi:MAG: hypothetical protein ACYSOQ_06940, partial [Planctomycetota bacterium]